MDINFTDVLSKALDTSTNNGNNVLDPVFLSKIVSEQVRTIPSLRNAIPRISWQGKAYTWDLVTDFGTAQTQIDGGNISLSDASFAQASANMSFYYYATYITNPAILAAQELLDLVSTRVVHAVKQTVRKEGSAIYNGDPLNASNNGLKAQLLAGPNANIIGAGATANRSMFINMHSSLWGQGYTPGCYAVSPNVYAALQAAAFNNVRFLGVADTAQLGFPLVQGNLAINGVPVIMDYYAQSFVPASSASMVNTSGNNYKFSADGSNALANQKTVMQTAGSDFAGTSWAAPVVKVSGVTKSAGTDYTFQPDGSITFGSTPGATPAANFTYAQDNVYCLSLAQTDLVIAELMGMQVDNDLGKPVTTDSIPLRVKEYCTLAVRDTKAHILASNVIVPAASAFES